MDGKVKYLLLRTVQDNNILPVTSVCNMACQFCSHRNNPPGLDVYSLGHLSLALIEELIDYLPAKGPVIIGESATRIIEGDPMTHPYFSSIIEKIREKYPKKTIKITTNGSYLDSEAVNFLQENDPIELNISLNCSSPEERAFLMADKRAKQVFSALELVGTSSLRFNGSIVAMPHLLGWKALQKAIDLLISYRPESIRVFMPGFTCYSSDKLKFEVKKMYRKLVDFIEYYNESKVPVLLEPAKINDFMCRIKGIIPDSPAENLELKKGDIIKAVNNEKVINRVDGFNKIVAAADPVIKYERAGDCKEFIFKKKAGESSGLIVDYDLDIDLVKELTALILQNSDQKLAIITSILAEGIMNAFLSYLEKNYNSFFEPSQIDLIVVENNFFAGSIMTAGLLTNDDIVSKLKKIGKNYDLIILPSIIFDIFGNDLTGKNYREIEEELKTEVKII